MFGCLPRIKNLTTIMQYNYVYNDIIDVRI